MVASLYAQTLFDADRFETLAAMYEQQVRKEPRNLTAINSLIQVYSVSDRWEKTLHWMVHRAEIQRRDAEAQYAVGVFIQDLLLRMGVGNDMSAFDPRPASETAESPPASAPGDIVGQERVHLADAAIGHLKRALMLRPEYRDATVYANLVYRQRPLAFFVERWRNKALTLQRPQTRSGQTG